MYLENLERQNSLLGDYLREVCGISDGDFLGRRVEAAIEGPHIRISVGVKGLVPFYVTSVSLLEYLEFLYKKININTIMTNEKNKQDVDP